MLCDADDQASCNEAPIPSLIGCSGYLVRIETLGDQVPPPAPAPSPDPLASSPGALLATLANTPTGAGLVVKELKDGYPNIEDDLKTLEA
jgi:TFA2 Winged helix domain 2